MPKKSTKKGCFKNCSTIWLLHQSFELFWTEASNWHRKRKKKSWKMWVNYENPWKARRISLTKCSLHKGHNLEKQQRLSMTNGQRIYMEPNRDNRSKCWNSQKRQRHPCQWLLEINVSKSRQEKSLYWDCGKLIQYLSSCIFSKLQIRVMDSFLGKFLFMLHLGL